MQTCKSAFKGLVTSDHDFKNDTNLLWIWWVSQSCFFFSSYMSLIGSIFHNASLQCRHILGHAIAHFCYLSFCSKITNVCTAGYQNNLCRNFFSGHLINLLISWVISYAYNNIVDFWLVYFVDNFHAKHTCMSWQFYKLFHVRRSKKCLISVPKVWS